MLHLDGGWHPQLWSDVGSRGLRSDKASVESELEGLEDTVMKGLHRKSLCKARWDEGCQDREMTTDGFTHESKFQALCPVECNSNPHDLTNDAALLRSSEDGERDPSVVAVQMEAADKRRDGKTIWDSWSLRVVVAGSGLIVASVATIAGMKISRRSSAAAGLPPPPSIPTRLGTWLSPFHATEDFQISGTPLPSSPSMLL
jgi:hypothetical protein